MSKWYKMCLIIASFALGSIFGILVGRELFTPTLSIGAKVVEILPEPVCHALTEDSDITDCYYDNGAWRTK